MLQVDTSLAENTLKSVDQATGAIIPPNVVANKFIHYTFDKIDILDETLDGKNTFHATQMAARRRGKTNYASLKHIEPSIRQASIVPTVLEELHHVSTSPGRDYLASIHITLSTKPTSARLKRTMSMLDRQKLQT